MGVCWSWEGELGAGMREQDCDFSFRAQKARKRKETFSHTP